MRSYKSFCRTEHGDVYYWTAGSGPALLLLHQASQSSAEYAAIAPLLTGHFTVIGFDYPGHGRSDDPERELGVLEFCDVAIAVLDELGVGQAHVCGHHTGGVLAINLAVEYADRVASVVMSGVGVRTEEGVRAVLDTPMTRDLPVDAEGEFLERTWQVYRRMSSPGIPPEKTFEFFIEGLAARSRPYDAHHAVLRWDRDPVMARMRKPTLLIHGEHDNFAEAPEQMAAQIEGSRFVRIAGGGAFLFYEQPAACAEAIIAFIIGV